MRRRLLRLRDLMALAEHYEQRLDEIQHETAELVAFIEGIEDPITREAFTMRYVRGLNWVQTAHRLRGVTPDSIRMAHNRLLGGDRHE